MSKYAQKFNPVRPIYKMVDGDIVQEGEYNVQEKINSYYDETLYRRLESYFESVNKDISVSQDIEEDFEDFSEGSRVDRVSSALTFLREMKQRYNVPEECSDEQFMNIVRQSSEAGKEVETNAQVVEQKSEQEEL